MVLVGHVLLTRCARLHGSGRTRGVAGVNINNQNKSTRTTARAEPEGKRTQIADVICSVRSGVRTMRSGARSGAGARHAHKSQHTWVMLKGKGRWGTVKHQQRHPHPRIRRCTHQAPRETTPPTPPTQTQPETPQTRSVAAPDTMVYSNPIGRRISVSAGAAAATVVAALEAATGAAPDPALAGAGAGDTLGANAVSRGSE